MRGRPFAVRAVHLPVDVTSTNEQDGVLARRGRLAFIEEPECARQRHRVKHVRADGNNHVHSEAFDQFLPYVLLGRAGIPSRVSHHKPCSALFIECRVKELDPQIIGVVSIWQAKGETPFWPYLIFETLFIDRINVEGRIS